MRSLEAVRSRGAATRKRGGGAVATCAQQRQADALKERPAAAAGLHGSYPMGSDAGPSDGAAPRDLPRTRGAPSWGYLSTVRDSVSTSYECTWAKLGSDWGDMPHRTGDDRETLAAGGSGGAVSTRAIGVSFTLGTY